MPFNGAGVFSIVNTFISGTTIFSSAVNANFTDIATGLSTAVLKNGTQTVTADIPMSGFGFTGVAKLSSQAVVTVASAATTDILGQASLLVAISGTATITSLGTGTNTIKFVRATGAFTLTHNAASLILPGGANIIMQSGDTFVAISDASSNVRIYALQRATGHPLVSMPGYRNLLRRNGGIEIWQRSAPGISNAVTASTTAYTADGWYLITNANQASAVVSVAGLGSAQGIAAKVQRNNGQTGTGVMRFAFPMDSLGSASTLFYQEVALCRGQFLVLTFRAKAGANWSPASGNLNFNLYFGNTGTAAKRGASGYTGETNLITGVAALTTTDTLYTAYATAAAGTDILQGELQFSWTPVGTAGADDSFTVDDVQLEIIPALNAAPSPFERIGFAEMLALCQVHYCKSFEYGATPAQNYGVATGETSGPQSAAASTGANTPFIPYPVPMRTAATVTTYNPAAAASSIRDETNSLNWTATTVAGSVSRGFRLTGTTAAGSSQPDRWGVHWTADASI